MANLDNSTLPLQDYFTLTKLSHTLAGLYIWETVFTVDFELNVLRGKQPYRWTIWIYLGTRYTCLLAYIFSFVVDDGGHVPCQLLIVTAYAFFYASWAFASLIIVLRIIAIWNRNTIVSSIAVATWLAALGINIRTVTLTESAYDPLVDACLTLNTHRGLVSAVAILIIDTLLLMMMLTGLLRHTHRRSTGLWNLLYKQCIGWLVLAAIAEIPAVVFLSLNLNDARNQMFLLVAITILSICATRMYRSLCKRGTLTEYLSDPPSFPSGLSVSNHQRREAHSVPSTLHFATDTQPDRAATELSVFKPAEQIQVEFVPAAPDKTESKDMPGYQMSWPRTG